MKQNQNRNILDVIASRRVYLDGAMGSLLQAAGLPAGESPELWNLERPDVISDVHRSYLEVGCDGITSNTFGVNCLKFENYEELIRAAFECAKDAAKDFPNAFIGFDIGPTGRLLEPLGDLPFEEAVRVFSENLKLAEEVGADYIIIETMNDSHETKAAVLAAKETCPNIPVFVSNVFDEGGKLMTGANAAAMTALLEGLGADVIGMNCSLGPAQMAKLIPDYVSWSSTPVLVMPNAGLPRSENGRTVYDVSADEFASIMKEIALAGATVLGGCCGTTPEYLKKTIELTRDLPYSVPEKKDHTLISSYTHAVEFKKGPILIGERVNPTGKKLLKQALREENMNYILQEALKQADAGVPVLDVNVGLPEIDEPRLMVKVIREIQAVCDAPLQLDTTDPAAMEQALRIYNGKALINSVNGTKKSMDAILPLAAKYGGTLIALTVGEDGIPGTAEGRVQVALDIAREAEKYGISRKDIIVDPLAMAVSSAADGGIVTLQAVAKLHELGFGTSLGISNISFGLPTRDRITSTFFTMCLEAGLDAAIMNPFSDSMMSAYHAWRVLRMQDMNCGEYIAYATAHPMNPGAAASSGSGSAPSGTNAAGAGSSSNTPGAASSSDSNTESELTKNIRTGMKQASADLAKQMISSGADPYSLINEHVIPALNRIGNDFEKKIAFLPQLLMAAESATAAFEVIKASLPAKDASDSAEGMVLCTVQGDVHDIGKNIVKVLLESFGFRVYDLGRDVAPETVVETVRETGCRLVGLSALMTTTVPAMEETIKQVKAEFPDAVTVVGGAVLTQEYADMIHADYYAPDAMDTVRFTKKFYGK